MEYEHNPNGVDAINALSSSINNLVNTFEYWYNTFHPKEVNWATGKSPKAPRGREMFQTCINLTYHKLQKDIVDVICKCEDSLNQLAQREMEQFDELEKEYKNSTPTE